MTAVGILEQPAPSFAPGTGLADERVLLAFTLAGIESLLPRDRMILFGKVDDSGELSRMGLAELRAATGRAFPRADWNPSLAAEEAKRGVEFCRRRGIGMVCVEDPEYPPSLREIHEPPFMLFHRGPLPDAERPCVAIVGTRHPSMEAYASARRISLELAVKGVPVVSGLALGIDRAAHEGAISAGGYTLAVLGSGIDSIYPRSHVPLASRMLDSGGCLLSEYPPGREPLKFRFPERNRIISGLSRSVLVAQAPEKSGALITAEFALDQGRDLLVMRGGMEGESGAGSRKLAEDGACAVDGAEDIVAEWGY